MGDDMTPERLDAILDGTAAPDTDEDRAMLHLAADLRGAAPRASDALRERIIAMGEPGEFRPKRVPFWKRINVLAPALGAVVAVIVAVGVLTTGNSGDDTGFPTLERGGGAADSAVQPPAAAPTQTMAEPAPMPATGPPAEVTVEAGGLDDALAEIESIAGGPRYVSESDRTATSAVITVTVPADRHADVARGLTGIGHWPDPQALAGHTPGSPMRLRLSEETPAP